MFCLLPKSLSVCLMLPWLSIRLMLACVTNELKAALVMVPRVVLPVAVATVLVRAVPTPPVA
ncbi:hypothetical protein [Moraxella catarrhalis]|uniref:hypothetical protein n=1 Tax=Moraxella catarrhalis TaxID=480 RepID=UPI001D0DB433|nr:hypothetical protein [Moraxella catarrhalis]